jgi:DNA-binding GntR family transcriptional regulator
MKNAAALPRYQVVAQALMRDLEKGKFKIGSLLPTEMEICERFGISRHTAREAIRRLTDAGLVTRRAGIGTTIQAQAVSARYTASVSDPGELIAFTRKTRLDLLAFDRAEIQGELAEIIPQAVGQRWPRFTLRRFVEDSDVPIAYAEIIVHPDFEAIREKIHKPGVTVYRLIEELRGRPAVELKQDISCIALPKKMASMLGASAGTPALRVLRYYLGEDESLLSVAINTYPRDRFKITTRWRLGGPSNTI